MKPKQETPFIAQFFKGLSLMILMWGVVLCVLLQLERGLLMIFGAGPCLWWMGEVIDFLAQIARKGVTAAPVPVQAAAPPSRKDLESMIGSQKTVRRESEEEAPPTFQL